MQYLRQAASAVTDALDSFNSARLYNYTGNRIFVTLLLWNHDSLEKNENGTVTLTEDAFGECGILYCTHVDDYCARCCTAAMRRLREVTPYSLPPRCRRHERLHGQLRLHLEHLL